MKPGLKDDSYRFWDIIIKAVSSFLTILTITIAIFTYLDNQRKSIEQQEREYRKDLAARQINYYSEISQSIGELLTVLGYRDSIYTNTYFSKRNNFSTLYYGKMNLIESQAVDSQLKDFFNLLEKYETDDSPVQLQDLRLAAFEVNRKFRESILETYDVKIDSLTK